MTIETPFCPLVDTKEAAEIIGLTYSVMLGLRRTGKGPKCVKLGRKYLYDLNAVTEWRKEKFAPLA
jgi:predicted DNA-binding transcriptional regulator AlpA